MELGLVPVTDWDALLTHDVALTAVSVRDRVSTKGGRSSSGVEVWNVWTLVQDVFLGGIFLCGGDALWPWKVK